jgi:hypothetical protein
MYAFLKFVTKKAPKLIVYDRYCKNYDRATDLYEQMMKETAFAEAVERQRTKWTMRVGGLLLHDFLIKPIQRICKYPLLFKALIGFTPETHSDMALLKVRTKKTHKSNPVFILIFVFYKQLKRFFLSSVLKLPCQKLLRK